MKIRQSKATKLFAVLLALCFATICLPVSAFAAGSGSASISVTFRGDSASLGKVEIKSGAVWSEYSGSGAQDAEAVRICPNEDYSVDWTGISLRVGGENILTDDIRSQLTSENGYALTADTQYALEDVEFRQGGGSPGPGPEPGNPAHGGYEGERKIASFTIDGIADFYINDSQMINGDSNDNRDHFDNVSYTYEGNGTVDFYFNCFINQRITELTVNGVDYYGELPTPYTPEGKKALLDACKGQLYEFKITVPYNESGYTIKSSVKFLRDEDGDTNYMVIGNFLWTYTDENQGDDYIDHGRMELVQVSYDGTDYLPEDLNNPGTAIDWGQDENGGGAVLPVGAVVTVKLLPDYGYQLTRFGINGGDFKTSAEQSVFTFEIKPGNAHLGADFTPVADKVTSSSGAVTTGSIALGRGLSGGSAQLEISDAERELSAEKVAAFEAAAGDYSITDYLNLDLYNVYYKGSTDEDNVWKNEVNTLEDDATISVRLTGTINPSDIVIIHNIHNGEDFETIQVDSYDPATNTITFRTSSFSTYAIATVEESIPEDPPIIPGGGGSGIGSGSGGNSSGSDHTQTGWVKDGDNWYYLSAENGETQTGWVKDGDTWYYLDEDDGAMQTGWVKDGDAWYYLDDDNGAMQTGWVQWNNQWYYCGENGAMVADGWTHWNGQWYYCDKSGAMVANGWTHWNGAWYYCGNDGVMQANRWVQWNGAWYYCGNDGVMLTNTITPDGYYVDGEGKWIY